MALLRYSSFKTLACALMACAGATPLQAQNTQPAQPATTASATSAASAPATFTAPSIPFTKYRLANGLEIILAEDHRLPLVAFNLWVHAGPRNEAKGQTGFAHLFEHLMFAGTRHIARGKADQIIDAAGGTDSNGSTDFDRTNYYFTLPSNQLELGLWIKSDMLGYMTDQVDAVALANQQDVVRNERRQSSENRPYGIADEQLYQALYPADHPYRARIIGSHADIQSIRLADVHAFARTYYRPNNATLVLAGDFDPVQARTLLQRYFGSLQAGPTPPAVQVPAPQITREKRLVVQDRIELPRLTLAWHSPAAFAADDAELDIAANVLAGGKASRLYRKLVYQRQIAQSVVVQQSAYSLGSVFSVEVVARPGHTLDEIERAVDAELALLARQAPSAAEMARVRSAVQTRMVQQLERVGTLADTLNYYNQLTGDPGAYVRDLARYRDATPDGVRAAVARHLRKNSRVVLRTVPGTPVLAPDVPVPAVAAAAPAASAASASVAASAPGQAVALNADEPWRNDQPQPGPARPLSLPTGKTLQLANGLTVIHVPQHKLPLVSATLVLRAGQDRTPPTRPGLAGFASDMLQEGTTTRSAEQIANGAADLGASFDTEFGTEDTRLRITSLAGQFPAALGLLADSALHPAFAPAEVARRKQARTNLLVSQRDSIAATAAVVARAAYYGADHPLGASPLGNAAAIQATSAAELRSFWQRWARPDQAALVVSGDVSEADLLALAQAQFGGWTAPAGAGAAASSVVPAASAALLPTAPSAPPVVVTPRIVLVDKPGASQTALQFMAPGPMAGAPDAAASEIVNNALGGLFTSRINQQLREVKGYTYGMRSGYAMGRSATHWSLRGSVRGDVTGASLQEIVDQLDRMRAAPMPADELQRVRNASLLSLPGEFDTNDAVATRLASAWSLGLPADHYTQWPARLLAVDSDQAFAATLAHVLPRNMAVIAVGNMATVRQQIDAANASLKLGPLERRDADGRRLP